MTKPAEHLSAFGDISVGDLVALAIGASALVVTILLTIIGVQIALDNAKTKRLVEEMQKELGAEKERLFGLRAAAKTLGSFLSDATLAIDIQRRATENLMAAVWSKDPLQLEVFTSSILGPLVHLERLQKYIEIMSPHDPENFPEDVRTLCDRFPDLETANTLDELSAILPPNEAKIANVHAQRLRRSLSRAARRQQGRV